MNDSTPPARLPEALTGPVARLALRQQNLRCLFPVLLHDVNGALNGLALSSELLARLLPAVAGSADAASNAGNLLQRTRAELGRLKDALRSMESRLAPVSAPGSAAPRTAVGAALQDLQTLLMPAVRRSQLEWQAPAAAGDSVAVAVRPEDSFDLLVGLAIIAIESAPVRSALELTTALDGECVLVGVGHTGGPPQASFALELHRELLRAAVAYVGGSVEWQQSARSLMGRMRLPRAVD